jgi:Holliday junction resolvase RusA-like endonuclease
MRGKRWTRWQFTVPGIPVPQGSMSSFNGYVVHQHDRELKAWRALIQQAASDVMVPLEGSVHVTALFVVPRKPSVRRDEPHVRPDLDKYARALLDGLTGAAFADDGQVTRLIAEKAYGPRGGVVVAVEGWADAA